MIYKLKSKWFLEMLLGVGLILFGFYCFGNPIGTVLFLSKIFAFLLFGLGFFMAWQAFALRYVNRYWYSTVLEGIIFMVFSLIIMFNPSSILFFTKVLGLWMILTGIFRFISIVIHNSYMTVPVIGSFLIILFGMIFFFYSDIIAAFISIIVGLLLVVVGSGIFFDGYTWWKYRGF